MNKEIPKIIWMLWFQGWENAPQIVQRCKSTWIEHNPNWTIHFLTTDNLSDFIDLETVLPGYKDKKMQPEALSNIIRMALLIKYGGVWADSTLYCNKPLDEWLPQCASHSGFFAFANPGPDRMLSTWFLAASQDHIITTKWYAECLAYWSTRTERHTYFWCHYLFGNLYTKDEAVKDSWDKTPSVSANDPHYFLPYEETLYKPLSRKVKKVIDEPDTPVFKLTFKYDEQLVRHNSVIQYLLSDKKKPGQSKTIIIVGMHRSGTSLTASLLQHSGLDIGGELLGSETGNVQGHYENVDFLDFHRSMLKKLNKHPDGWDKAEIGQLDCVHEAEEIIESNKSGLWGWKEPRTTLFLDFWTALLPDAYFLFIYRSPAEVVDSIFRRGTDPVIIDDPEKAIDVWLHYNKLVLKHYEKFKDRSLLLHIKSIIHAYPECIHAINEKFNIDLHPEMKNVFDKGLFNEKPETHIFRGKLLYENKPEVLQVYEELLNQSWHPEGIDYRSELSFENNSDRFTEFFFNQWRDQYLRESQLNQKHNSEISDLKHRYESEIARLKQENDAEIRSLTQEHEHGIAELKKSIQEKDQVISDLQAEIGWMKQTKYWKLREEWHTIKSILGYR